MEREIEWTAEELQKKTVPQLIRIVKDLKLPTGHRKKDVLIQKILNSKEETAALQTQTKRRRKSDNFLAAIQTEETQNGLQLEDEEDDEVPNSETLARLAFLTDDSAPDSLRNSKLMIFNFQDFVDIDSLLETQKNQNEDIELELITNEKDGKQYLKIGQRVFQKNDEYQSMVVSKKVMRGFEKKNEILFASENSWTELMKLKKSKHEDK